MNTALCRTTTDRAFRDPSDDRVTDTSKRVGVKLGIVGAMLSLQLLGMNASHAATYVVPSPCCATIQSGIDQSAAGDTVFVLSGTYQGPGNVDLSFHGKDIVLLGEDRDGVVIDGQGTSRLLVLEDGETVAARVERLTLSNGWSSSAGGGVRLEHAGLTISNCAIIGCNGGTSSGGGLFASSSTMVLDGCTLAGNFVQRLGGALSASSSDLTIRNCSILGNSLLDTQGKGAGIHASRCTVLIENTLFGGNYARYSDGGGLFLYNSISILRGNTFAGNLVVSSASSGTGGGVTIFFGDTSIEQCAFFENCAFPAYGSDLYGWEADVTVECSYALRAEGTLDFLGPQIEGEVNPCYPVACTDAPTQDGIYTVRDDSVLLPENNPCGVLIGIQEQGCSVTAVPGGSGSERYLLPVRVEPNPVRSVATLEFALTDPSDVELTLYDAQGKRRASARWTLDGGEHEIALESMTHDLAAGAYFATIRAGHRIGTARLVVVR